jgi:phosphoribosyl 1,2-cyclic phosphodiesterase
MGFFVSFWGVRGSIPTPGHATQKYGGNTACIEVRIDNKLFVFDGGSGLRPLGSALQRRQKRSKLGPIEIHMFFSHSHWDHIQGFPFFIPAYDPSTVIHVYGPEEGDQHFFELLNGQMRDDYFPVQFHDLGAQIKPAMLYKNGTQIDDTHVEYYDTHHPGGSIAYSISSKGKKVVYSTDNELDQLLLNYSETLKSQHLFRQSPEDFIEFCKDADLLIADGQYTDQEYRSHIHWGHPRATTLVDLCHAANIKQLAITHHDPLQTDKKVDQKIDDCRIRADLIGYKGVIFGAREGIELKFA